MSSFDKFELCAWVLMWLLIMFLSTQNAALIKENKRLKTMLEPSESIIVDLELRD